MRREREDGVKSDVLGHRLRHPEPDKETGLRPRICKTFLKQDKVMATPTITNRGKVLDTEKVWLSNAEAQAYLGMSAGFFKDLRANAQLRFYKVRGAVFYKKTDIDRLVEKGRAF